ncbi:phage major capsid protein [Spirosoma foliorum]|uniref:Phage major capsid protein n=1 Tax=Spirosoma foliorum TaxID=2710596 RepID=A0A7G5H2I5_9BACT|nr:phage major capsid protein [Spirosoma foliorum]QMW05327.1 phage major capsid protein [Spirosoma foliorum]
MNEQELIAALEAKATALVAQVKGITDPLDAKLKQIEETFKEGGTKVDPALKAEVEKLAKMHETLATQIDQKFADIATLRNSGKPGSIKSLNEVLFEEFNKKEAGSLSIVDRIKGMASGSMGKNSIDVNIKAVADMSSAGNLTGTYFQGYDLRPGVTIRPLFDAHLRPTIPATTTEKPLVRYVRETTSEGGFDMVAEGAEKPEIDWDFDIVDAPVRKIAGIFRLPEEMIDDIPYLLTYLTTRGMEELKNKEDQQILYGTGSGQQLSGVFQVATQFAAGGLTGITTPNYFDVLVAAKKQLRLLNLVPNFVWVSPEDYAKMRLSKATTGEYIFPVLPGTDTITVDGTPIIQNNRINTGSFVVLDTRWMEIADRMQSTVRLFDQDRDNVIKNLVTCVIEERLAFPIYRPQAIIKGTFTDAIAAIA